jgi:arginase family enzyme
MTNLDASTTVALTTYRGRAGDHNDVAMAASAEVGTELGRRFELTPTVVGEPAPALSLGWADELDAARGDLQAMARRYDDIFARGQVPVSAITRCAVALATVPAVARRHPDAVVVWLDAHGDLNTPGDTTSGYLGGMALSGPLGWWDSTLGAGLGASNAVLVGARDLDAAERAHIEAGRVAHIPVGRDTARSLGRLLAGRPVYFHLDCDVLEPGIVATDYEVPDGLTLDQLHSVAVEVARSEIVGVEIGEFEGAAASSASELVVALEPLWQQVG